MTSRPLPAAQFQLQHANQLGSSFGQKSSRALRWLGRARTWWWGPLFSQANVLLCFASTALRRCRSFLRPPTRGRSWQSAVTGGRIHSFPALISDDYGGEGKTASCRLRKIARELRILPRCPHQSRYQLFLHSLSFLLLFKPRPSSISSIHLPLTNYSFR